MLVVLLVVGILASMAIVRYRTMKQRGYVATMKTDLGTLRIAEEGYWAENQSYTVDTLLLDFKSTSGVPLAITSADLYAGFDVQAVHAKAPGLTCNMYVGRAVSGAPSGEIRC